MAGDMRLEYTVDAETGGMLSLTNAANKAERGVVKSFNKMDAAVSKLSAAFTAVSAAISANQIVKYAESWAVVNNKLANSVRENEKLADVTERVLAISQDSRSSLDSTASLYSRLERATRSAGTSTSDLINLTETINKAFIVSGATTAEAESAVIQLSQGLASGTLRGEEFNSVNEQGNRLIVALSESLGVTSGKLRELAFDGKLTTDVVVKGLLQQGDKIATEFTKTMQTFGQATTIATNNLTEWVGSSVTVKAIVGEMGDGVVSLSQNLETVAQVAAFAGLAFGSKLVGGLTLSTQAALTNAVASAKLATAELATSKAAERRAIAEKQAAQVTLISAQEKFSAAKIAQSAEISLLQTQKAALTQTILNTKSESIRNTVRAQLTAVSIQLAAAQKGETATTAQLTAATTALSAAKGRLTTTTGAANLATVATATAQTAASATARTMTVATTGLKTAMTFLGGPVGVIMLAASALYMFKTAAADANGPAERLAESLDKMGTAQARLMKIKLVEDIQKTKDSLTGLNHRLELTIDPLTRLTDAKREEMKIVWAAKIEKENMTLQEQIDKLKEVNAIIDGTASRKSASTPAAQKIVIPTSGKEELKAKKKALKEMLDLNKQIDQQELDRYNLSQQQRETGISANPMLNEQARFQKELDALKLSEQLKLTTKQEYMALEAGMIATHEENKRAIMEETFRGMNAQNEMLMSTFDSLHNAATNVFSGMLSGTMSATDAMKSFGNAILNEAIGSLVQMGIEQVKQMVMGKALQATQTAATMAQAAAVAAAWQPAAMAASIATSGGAAVAGSAAYTASMASTMLPVAGGRLYGGATQAGKAYRVNENGRPEMYTNSSGQQFMMGSDRGHVTPAGEMGDKSVVVNQTFNVEASATYDQKAMQQVLQAAKIQTTQIMQDQMRQGGMLAR